MGRQEAIARSIASAIVNDAKQQSRSILAAILAFLGALFTLYQLPLRKICKEHFAQLRRECWFTDDNKYVTSFMPGDRGDPWECLHAIGDMGFSGSTFYSTADQRYLAKSVPRHSEHSFFRDDLLVPYVQHMRAHPASLFVRICDFLGCETVFSLGRILRLAPSHHIIMDNILYGQERAKEQGRSKWEQWDLKPTSYFYPERDIAGGRLTSDATKDMLADEFHDKIILTREQADEFFAALEEDTQLLAQHNAVDYSLFLVRIKTEERERPQDIAMGSSDIVPDEPPAVPPSPPSWRTGIPSPDGKHVFRAAVLDFFWAKHKVQPRLMTLLITLWNVLVSRQGHMSITTTPDEYRTRFLKMCRSYVEVHDGESH